MTASKWKETYLVDCKKYEEIEHCRGPKCFYFKDCWRGIFQE